MNITNIFSWKINNMRSYNLFHLFFLFLLFIILKLITKNTKKVEDKEIKKTVLIIGIAFWILELYKQLFFNVFESVSEYQWNIFPFQLCSNPLYLCLIYYFTKNKKVENHIGNFLAFYGVIAGASVMVYPNSVLVSEITISIQSMLWHALMIILGVYLINVKQLGKSILELLDASKVFIILTALALILNLGFHFTNLNGSFNMFFISPFYTSTIPVLSNIWKMTDWSVFLMFYIIGVSLGALLIWHLARLSYLNQTTQKFKFRK